MYPPVAIGTARVCMNKDTVIGGQLHLPAGTCVNLSHHSLQNASYNWDSPEKFMPGEEIFFRLRCTSQQCIFVAFFCWGKSALMSVAEAATGEEHMLPIFF